MNDSEGCEKDFSVVPILVEPKYGGNIGSIARCARNFEIEEMILISPPPIDDEAVAYSMHGREILDSATLFDSLEEVSDKFDYLVGTSGITWSGEKCYTRNPMTPAEMVDWFKDTSGRIGLVFGREDIGLKSEELMLCDALVTIPANPDYPILNLSHAACLLFYEIYSSGWEDNRRNSRPINGEKKRILLDHYDRLMDICRVPEHKKPIASIYFRRMISRSLPTVREFYSLMGTLSRAMDYKKNRRVLEELEER